MLILTDKSDHLAQTGRSTPLYSDHDARSGRECQIAPSRRAGDPLTISRGTNGLEKRLARRSPQRALRRLTGLSDFDDGDSTYSALRLLDGEAICEAAA